MSGILSSLGQTKMTWKMRGIKESEYCNSSLLIDTLCTIDPWHLRLNWSPWIYNLVSMHISGIFPNSLSGFGAGRLENDGAGIRQEHSKPGVVGMGTGTPLGEFINHKNKIFTSLQSAK